jgi:hypothetical protein
VATGNAAKRQRKETPANYRGFFVPKNFSNISSNFDLNMYTEYSYISSILDYHDIASRPAGWRLSCYCIIYIGALMVRGGTYIYRRVCCFVGGYIYTLIFLYICICYYVIHL